MMPYWDSLPDSDPCWGPAIQWVDSKHMRLLADNLEPWNWPRITNNVFHWWKKDGQLTPKWKYLKRTKICNSATTNYACADHYLTYFRLPYRPLQPGRPASHPQLQTNKGYSELTSWTGSQTRPLLLAHVGPSRWGKRHGSRRWNTPPVQEPPSSPPGNRSACLT